MSLKVAFKTTDYAAPSPVAPKKLSPPAAAPPPAENSPKKYEADFRNDFVKAKLNRQLSADLMKFVPEKPPGKPAPKNPDAERLEKASQQNSQEQFALRLEKAANDKIIAGDYSIFDKLKALAGNAKINDRLGRLETEKKIIDEHLSAIERGDARAVAFFDAMEQTNKSNDPWDMNPGDAFRESLDPAAQRAYDETLANLRNDPRVQFEFRDGAIDSVAMREIALRGLVAATFGRPQDLEQRIAAGAAASDNGKYTITYVPDSYKSPDGSEGWGARAGQTGIIARQGFTIQQIANENDNLFIHEFSHTLEAKPDGSIGNLPPDFGFINNLRFYAAFNEPAFQQYIGQTKVDAETFAGIQNRFRQNPQALKDVSPAMYQLMVDYSGFDPLSGSLIR